MGEVKVHRGQGLTSGLPTARGLVGVQRRQQIQDAGRGEKSSAVIAVGSRHIGAVNFESLRDPVKAAGADVGNLAESRESVAALRRKQIASHA